MNSLRIKIPSAGILLDTNSIRVTNLLKTGVTNYISNNYIVLDYYSNQVRSQEMDQIMITVNDSVININTNLTWSADASYNSTYNSYKPASLYAGDTLSVYYVQPAAHLNMNALPTGTSEDFPTNAYQILITNVGTEPNNVIYSLSLLLPDAITNITQITNLNPSNSAIFALGSNYLSVYYTNNNYTKPLGMGSTDTIQFIGWDKITNAPYSSNWVLTAANTTDGSLPQFAGLISGGNPALNIRPFPILITSIYGGNQRDFHLFREPDLFDHYDELSDVLPDQYQQWFRKQYYKGHHRDSLGGENKHPESYQFEQSGRLQLEHGQQHSLPGLQREQYPDKRL